MLILHDLCHLQLGTLKLGLTPTWKCPLIYLRPAAIFYYLYNIRHIRKLKRTYYIVVLFFSCSSHTDDVSWELAQPRASFKNLSVGGHQEKGTQLRGGRDVAPGGGVKNIFMTSVRPPVDNIFGNTFLGVGQNAIGKVGQLQFTIYNSFIGMTLNYRYC